MKRLGLAQRFAEQQPRDGVALREGAEMASQHRPLLMIRSSDQYSYFNLRWTRFELGTLLLRPLRLSRIRSAARTRFRARNVPSVW